MTKKQVFASFVYHSVKTANIRYATLRGCQYILENYWEERIISLDIEYDCIYCQ